MKTLIVIITMFCVIFVSCNTTSNALASNSTITTGGHTLWSNWVEKTSDFTASVNTKYLCTNGAGQGIFITLPGSPSDGDDFTINRSGHGAVLIESGTINGAAYKLAAIRKGQTLVLKYDSGTTSWWTNNLDVGMMLSTGLVQGITAQKGYTAVGGTSNDTWADQSGNGYTFTTNASATDPTYSATSGGGSNHPGVTFNGSNYMDAADGSQWNFSTLTFVCGFKPVNRNLMNIVNHFSSGPVGFAIGLGATTAGKLYTSIAASTYSDTGTAHGEEFEIFAVIKTTAVAAFRYYVGGRLNSESASGTIGDSTGYWRLGANTVPGSYMDGPYLGHAVYSTVLTESQRNYVERFYLFSGID